MDKLAGPRWMFGAVALTACTASTSALDPDARDPIGPDAQDVVLDANPADVDARPPGRTGGWRSRGGDASQRYRGGADGPRATATGTVIAENPAENEFASVSTPIVDEDGNLYLLYRTPGQPTELVSLRPDGTRRWQTTGAAGFSDLNLGADGHLYAVGAVGSGPNPDELAIVSYDTSGVFRGASAPTPGLYKLLMPADGSLYALTYTQADGYRTRAFDGLGSPRWDSPHGGDAIAASPSGDLLILVDAPSGDPRPPRTVIALDTRDAGVRWRHELDPAYGTPALAIDDDGSVYVAVSEYGTDLHVLRFSANGSVLWDYHDPAMTWPRQIAVGQDIIAVATQVSGYQFAGVTLEKTTGRTPSGAVWSCGEPQAIDPSDVIYWSCPDGVRATTGDRRTVASWPGRYTFAIVIGPGGAVYHVPAAYFADHQLFRIQ
jgi:hypothetical protein